MLDPIGGYRRIRDFFISYVETSFRISDDSVAASRRRLLETAGTFAADPFVEPVLRYKSADCGLDAMVGDEQGVLARLGTREAQVAFVELALSGLFDGENAEGDVLRKSLYAPYRHQVEMLRRGIEPGRPGIVTSGTGSGKTESFMLPILASLAREAISWQAPEVGFLSSKWWADDSAPWRPQRRGEKRPAAVRALILYPMNALVEDQMVRLRRTLDSDEARAVMERRFAGNRIFFGQYTSAVEVTGYEQHPRLADDTKEKKRRKQRENKLRSILRKAEEKQNLARAHDASERGDRSDPTRFIFPSLDGGEMISRWDMQVTPPDILVTNASMLGAMLSREVEEPIFDATRKWLEENDDAYFYLVFDELHLIRGSAGTEVSYLMKALLQRLGLDDPAHRHKLRILASSASLPMEGEEGLQSKRYLRDMFAPYGTSSAAGDPGTTDLEFWADCVVKGEPEVPIWTRGAVRSQPFVELLIAAGGEDGKCVASLQRNSRLDAAVAAAAAELGVAGTDEDVLVKRLAEEAAALLTFACQGDASSLRARSVDYIAERAFTDAAQPEMAVRGLMLARALPESGGWPDAKVDKATPSFRLHTFVRNIEGLFAAPFRREDGGVGFTELSVERGLSHSKPEPGHARGRRLFELLYCEACGDLLIGGQKGRNDGKSRHIELLPSTPELEKLPERAATEYYDRMTFEEFAVFWPKMEKPEYGPSGDDQWDVAALDPVSGVVEAITGGLDAKIVAGWIPGYLYYRRDSGGKPRAAQPFCCPSCGTDYSNRPASSPRRSPIRAFRTGVGKASQLVATELFELLHAIGADAKSIVFSDSRQDAANQALEIERLHLRDLRREVLMSAARASLNDARATQNEIDEKIDQLVKERRLDELKALMAQGGGNKISVENRKVQLDALFYYDEQTGEVGRLAAELVRLGIHPFDELGYKRWAGKPWHDAFEEKGGKIYVSNKFDETEKRALANAISKELLELVDDVIFANTFFALEETGLAYPSVSKEAGSEIDELDAWLRVFASATRVQENKYYNRSTAVEWRSINDIRQRNRVRRFAEAVFGGAASDELTRVLERFGKEGHDGGIVRAGKIYLRLAEKNDPYWRCEQCGRVHLHRGVGHCTRCYKKLTAEPSGHVEELWHCNFLGRRIVRGQEEGVDRFRLRCEELTGQTDDFAERLQKFKGIFVGDESGIARKAREIDLLSVTTTMEVGIDIGSLQTVYQANMPPQRFNYQQRVGRAGRRGQAFSLVVTFCRGRTHDAYYYAHPEAITGDPPPPPFLASEHPYIPQRLARKVWLRVAFKRIRQNAAECGEVYPGDFLSPPDIHGEYLPAYTYYADPEGRDWKGRLQQALADTIQERDRFIDSACISPNLRQRLMESMSVESLLEEIEAQRANIQQSSRGLAQFLAERGLLPMYGMPTRVKSLYLGLRAEAEDTDAGYDWSMIDRDLEVSIFEFAPGAVLTKDKKRHKVIGFTGTLAPPESWRRGQFTVKAHSSWRESEHYIAMCPHCGAGKYSSGPVTDSIVCDDCHGSIDSDKFKYYVTPAAFRTSFQPETDDQDVVGKMSTRTVATMLHKGETDDFGSLRVHRGAGVTIMQLNDGPISGSSDPERFTVQNVKDEGVRTPDDRRANALEDQAIDAQTVSKGSGRWTSAAVPERLGLAALKETDALFLELRGFDERLALNKVARVGESSKLPTRAAAISATQILVHKAALDLDVSPDEFEALEPRLRDGHPMLQIADALINGSGLVRRLGEARSDGKPHIVHLVQEVLYDTTKWPVADFLSTGIGGDHAEQCQTSCYRCIQRYHNRSYHGLLDWRLGLSYLRALVEPGYACGLEEQDEDLPECRGWQERTLALAESVAGMRPHALTVERHGSRRLPAIRHARKDGDTLYVLVHPLWRVDGPYGRALASSPDVKFVDTFNLERRPLWALENALPLEG